MTLIRALETWALAVVNSIPRAVAYLETRRISAPETAPEDSDTTDVGVNETPQVTCSARIEETDYALKARSPVGAPPRYGSRATITITVWTDATRDDQEEADAVAGLISDTLASPPAVDLSAFGDLIIDDPCGIEVAIEGDNRSWVITREVRALLR